VPFKALSFQRKVPTSLKYIIIAWLNLDLGFEMCFFDGLNGYWKTWLQLAFPVYIWTIAALIIVALHYSSLAVRIFGHNSVPVLSTLFLLSYAKLLRTIITAPSFTFLEYSNDTKLAVWTFVGDITYLSPTHIPLFLVALGFLRFLWLPYTVILLFRQCLQQATNYRVLQWIARLKPFFDAYHGPFKDKHRNSFRRFFCFQYGSTMCRDYVHSNSQWKPNSAHIHFCWL